MILSSAQANLLGTIIFVNAFVVTLPSWLNEKSHSVDVTPILWYQSLSGSTKAYHHSFLFFLRESLGFATIFRIAIGLFGGLAYCLTIKNCDGTRCQKKHAVNRDVRVKVLIRQPFSVCSVKSGICLFSSMMRKN